MTGAICGGVNTRYQGRVRFEGYRRYDLVGKPSKSYKVAFRRMIKAFAEGDYKRADVIFWADYYDPEVLCEIVRR